MNVLNPHVLKKLLKISDRSMKTGRDVILKESGCHKPGCKNISCAKCGKCERVRYCSRECQKKDWKRHKKVCGKEESHRIVSIRVFGDHVDEADLPHNPSSASLFLDEKGQILSEPTNPLFDAIASGSSANLKKAVEDRRVSDRYLNHRRSSDHATPLLTACDEGLEEMVDVLIQANADLELSSHWTNETPLLTAIHKGFSDIATKLVRAGANVNSSNHKKENVLVAALLSKMPDSLLLQLVKNGAKFPDEPLTVLILEGQQARVRFELDNPDAVPEDWIRNKAFHMVFVEKTDIEYVCTCGNDCHIRVHQLIKQPS